MKLSRRKLHALRDMLESPHLGPTALARTGEDGVLLVVEIETDAEHYGDRASTPASGRAG